VAYGCVGRGIEMQIYLSVWNNAATRMTLISCFRPAVKYLDITFRLEKVKKRKSLLDDAAGD
jgi:hypothetical protein